MIEHVAGPPFVPLTFDWRLWPWYADWPPEKNRRYAARYSAAQQRAFLRVGEMLNVAFVSKATSGTDTKYTFWFEPTDFHELQIQVQGAMGRWYKDLDDYLTVTFYDEARLTRVTVAEMIPRPDYQPPIFLDRCPPDYRVHFTNALERVLALPLARLIAVEAGPGTTLYHIYFNRGVGPDLLGLVADTLGTWWKDLKL